ELQVIIDPQRLAARQLTISDVRTALRNQNKDTSAGDFWESKRRWVIRTLGQFRSPEQVQQQILAMRDGVPIYVADVADVRVDFKKEDSVSRRYGISSNGLAVRRVSGANVLTVMQGLREATAELNAGALKQKELELYQYYDETDYIKSAMSLVQQNIVVGGSLTMIVLLLFLHLSRKTLLVVPLIIASALAAAYLSPWWFVLTLVLIVVSGFWFARGALVVGLAIPVSIIGTFLLLELMGRSLNVISLAGLAFAVGMLVDNAVVVLENIYRRHELGEPAMTAATRGTHEVAGAVLASTLTTIAVFLPVLFVQEMAGQLFRDIALAISCAVGLSLIISFTAIPTAAARLFRDTPHRHPIPAPTPNATAPDVALQTPHITTANSDNRPRSGVVGAISACASVLVTTVININRWIQLKWWRALSFTLTLMLACIGLTYEFWPKVEYLPAGNRNFVFCSVSPPPGYNLNQLKKMGETIEKDMMPYWNADPNDPGVEDLEFPMIRYYFYVVRGRQVFMGFQAHDPSRARELIPVVKAVASQFPGTLAVAKQSSLFERGLTGGRTIDIEITGPELQQLVDLGATVLAQVKQLMPEAQVMPRPSLDLSSPEIHIEP
ncbi:MAG: efflux RND transporter permease subunit, partial [Planctomycetaceae bacterium]